MKVVLDDFTSDAITVFPNPVTDQLHVEFDGIMKKVEIYDIAGGRLLNIDHQINKINTMSLSPGVYYAVFTTLESKKIMKKFIKE